MKKVLLITTAIALLLVGACKKPVPAPQPDSITVEVTGIENNCATITITSVAETITKAKVITADVETLDFDYKTSEIKLSQWIEANGVEVDLPYTTNVEKLKSGITFISAALGYNSSTGLATCSAFKVWESVGGELPWSEENSAGNLDDNKWN